ncbi:carbamate kinase [Thermoplasma volcanium GSS1]|uniref:Carbamate kinase n=1 Tax=Thermoplasma volcanium (strain ATCC 51530 / DSM 4299 / JCM 9571 / NBRC 15438 / GSS1) TaxID=273116 RepID=ARCC_THEVO|nr:carbamate kinase [Thermoplasma volcanium]Q97C45.1 RecName: Full=Carbamate kinase [Thermoplasma volcanium GSS1]BAB59402.1 carbamate kinase [Thermoplasma volcanium GSS1]
MVRIVIALGGNALLRNGEPRNYEVQYSHAIETFKIIRDITEKNETVITHGNGPQVGDIQQSHEISGIMANLHQSVAMSQGYIGEILANAYDEVRSKYSLSKSIFTIITRSVVNRNDPAFASPEKPIGRYYSDQEVDEAKRNGWVMKKFKDGWRRVVPSPEPIEILEEKAIEELVREGHIPLAVGGGGIPVVKENGRIVGIDAVIDKDIASSLLAAQLKADYFMILTDVESVYVNFGKPDQKPLGRIHLNEIEKYYAEGQFADGSMKPKVRAAINFVKNGGKAAFITNLENGSAALSGKAGTVIVP